MFDWTFISVTGLQETAALAAVALIGYLFGKRSRKSPEEPAAENRQGDLDRATRIAHQLESIAASLRNELSEHHGKVENFKRKLRTVKDHKGDQFAWDDLTDEAEAMLRPTLQLASQLSQAYDQIRRQSNALMVFSEARIDPATGVGNGRALDEQLELLLSTMSKGGASFAVALVSIDPCKNMPDPTDQDSLLQNLAGLVQSAMRDHDFVARYGGDEFVIVMPQTSLAGANVFGERLREKVLSELRWSICCGVAEAKQGDSNRELLARADSALYSAKASGTNRQFQHTGRQLREHGVRQVDTVVKTEEEILAAVEAIIPH